MARNRLTVRELMIAVAAVGLILGVVVSCYRLGNRIVNEVESDHYRQKAREVRDPTLARKYTRLADEYARRARYYGAAPSAPTAATAKL